MNKSNYTIDDIKTKLKEIGFILVSDKYKSMKESITIQCNKGHTFNRILSNFLISPMCPECRQIDNNQKVYERIRKYCDDNGFVLLSQIYLNQYSKLELQCSKEHIFFKDWKTIQKQGIVCPICSSESRKGYKKKRTPISEVIDMFESEGYKIIDGIETYENERSKFTLECPSHHQFQIDRNHFYHRKQRCPHCSNSKKLTLNYCREEFAKKDYILLEEVYVNSGTNMKYICKIHSHEIQYICWDNFKQGKQCKFCARENNSGENNHMWKGGLTSINVYLRGLLNKWKLNSLNMFNYKCGLTGVNNRTLNIHHLYSFHKIVKEVFSDMGVNINENIGDYNKCELELISERFLKKHNKIIGIPIDEKLHTLFHQIYNYDNTHQQFKEFVTRLRLGEFNDFLDENNLKLDINHEVLDKLLK